MSRVDYKQPWDHSELIQILSFINTHFDLWYKNLYLACVKSKEAIETTRDIKSIYGKVLRMIRAVEYYLKTGKKTRDLIIWKDKRIYDVLEKICRKFIEKKSMENQGIDSVERRRSSRRRNAETEGDTRDTISFNGDVVMNKRVKITR